MNEKCGLAPVDRNVSNHLASVSTTDLVNELCSRHNEAMFVGCMADNNTPINLVCHFPQVKTRMHSVLISALERVLMALRNKYAGARDVVMTVSETGRSCARN